MKIPAVTAAEYRRTGCFMQIGGHWMVVTSVPYLLKENIVLLEDDESSGLHFYRAYSAGYRGNEAEGAWPPGSKGSIVDPIVVAMYHQYLAQLDLDNPKVGPVPMLTREAALAFLDSL